MDADLFYSYIHWVQAVVRSGDLRSCLSASIRPPNRERLPRSLRKMFAEDSDGSDP